MDQLLGYLLGIPGGNLFMLGVSLFFLYFGADLLVKGSARLALSFGMQKIIVGLTLVAYGTSMPEFTVSLLAQLEGNTDVSIGNVIGSNIFNIAGVLGLTALIKPLSVNKTFIRVEVPVLLGFTLIFNLLCLNGKIGYNEGIILLILFFAYMAYMLYNTKKKKELGTDDIPEIQGSKLKNIIYAILGVLVLVAGSKLLITGGVDIAKKVGISDLVIGLTIVACGTSMPELFTSIVAAIKKEADISIGNVVGSNIFNIFFILGFVSLFGTLKLDNNISLIDNWVNLGLTLVLIPVMWSGHRISRIEGGFLLAFYVLYTLNLIYKWVAV